MIHARRSVFLGTILLLTAVAIPLRAQMCFGTPQRGGIAADFGKIDFGSTVGATAAYAGDRVAFGAGFHTVDRGSSTSGTAGAARFALVFGGKTVQICPGLGFEFRSIKWTSAAGKLTSSHLTGWGGVGVGLEQPVYRGFSVIPFASVRFAFTAVKYDLGGATSEVTTTGDTVSRGEIQYGVLGRYKIIYGGFIADHALKNAPPFLARWVLGLTFSAGGGDEETKSSSYESTPGSRANRRER